MGKQYTNANSLVKDIMRNYIIVEFSKSFSNIKNKKIFTLPADNFIFEKKLLQVDSKIDITCVERDKTIYNRGAELVKREKLPINYYNCTDTEYLVNNNNRFHSMWLDYCGPISKNLLSSLIPIVQGRHSLFNDKRESLLCITLLKGREMQIKDICKEFGFKNSKTLRNNIPNVLNTYAQWAGNSIEVQKIIEYRDGIVNPKASTMILYIMKIKEGIKKTKNNITPILIKY